MAPAESARRVAKTAGIERFARTPLARTALLLTAAVAWPLATHAHEAFTRLSGADLLRPVAAEALLHVAMLVASALCWRRAFRASGGAVGCADACVRHGVGTVLNAVTPARAGGAVRIGLFARSFHGERAVQRSAVALTGIGSVRAAAVALLVAGAAAFGLAPRWLLLAPAVLAAAAILTQRRVHAVRTHLHVRDCAALFGWAALAAACRCASIGAALVAVGVHAFGIVATAAFIVGRADRDVPVPVW